MSLPVTFQPGGLSISLRKVGPPVYHLPTRRWWRQSRPLIGRWLAGTCWLKQPCSSLENILLPQGDKPIWREDQTRRGKHTVSQAGWVGVGQRFSLTLALDTARGGEHVLPGLDWAASISKAYHCPGLGTRGSGHARTSQGLPGSCILHRAQHRRRKEGRE